ncbi:hypothetical protein MRX96_057806 [Rhipicephalus microplus]
MRFLRSTRPAQEASQRAVTKVGLGHWSNLRPPSGRKTTFSSLNERGVRRFSTLDLSFASGLSESVGWGRGFIESCGVAGASLFEDHLLAGAIVCVFLHRLCDVGDSRGIFVYAFPKLMVIVMCGDRKTSTVGVR